MGRFRTEKRVLVKNGLQERITQVDITWNLRSISYYRVRLTARLPSAETHTFYEKRVRHISKIVVKLVQKRAKSGILFLRGSFFPRKVLIYH